MNTLRYIKTTLVAGVAFAPLCIGGVALAQSNSAPVPASTVVGEIVVTAQKRSERLLDVPASVSVTTGQQLTAAGITSTGDLQQVSPGLVSVSNGIAYQPSIRGISSIGTSPGDESNVSLYLDDVYIGAAIAGLFDFKDIQQVEVSKGPQGTLFGRNATGGAIRIETLAPSFSPRAEVSADYGFDFNQTKLGGYATGPITDQLAGSLDLFYKNSNGPTKGIGPDAGRTYGYDNTFSTRGKLLFKPLDTFRVTIAADYSRRHDNSIYADVPINGQNVNRTNPAAIIPGDFQYSGSTQPIANITTDGVSVDAVWDPLSYLTVRSISAYRYADGLYQVDSDRTNLAGGGLRLDQKQKTLSQEFDVTGPSRGVVTWVAGLYYYYSDAGNPYFNSFSTDAPHGVQVAGFRDSMLTNSYAAFGELTYNPTSKLHLTFGGRYTEESKHFLYTDTVRAAGIRTANAEKTYTDPTYRAVVRYDLTEKFNVYASASDGFKSGVYNAYALPAVPVQPEKIDAYEIGTKAEFKGITFTAAAFDYEYNNIQVQSNTFVNGAFVVLLQNAARAQIQGFEATASGNLSDHFSFNLGVSALPTARYSSFTTAQVFIPNLATGGATSVSPYDSSGSRIIRAPRDQADARLTYTNALFGGEFAATGTYSYNSGFFFQSGDFSPQKAYGVVNGRLSWTDPKGRLTYSLWAENLTDTHYSIYTASNTISISRALADPRLIGIGVAAKF